jgi:tRNA threonylcarbamoyladenosine biosynthesis protein TsaB
MYLGIRTDSPVAEFYLYERTSRKAEKTWQADRQLAHGLLGQLESFLSDQGITFHDLKGLFVYQGPGSFTGLRIGITVMNTIAYSEGISIIGSEGEAWCDVAVSRLDGGENDQVVLPHYGADPRITKPTK